MLKGTSQAEMKSNSKENPCKNSPAVKKGEAKNAQVTDFGV